MLNKLKNRVATFTSVLVLSAGFFMVLGSHPAYACCTLRYIQSDYGLADFLELTPYTTGSDAEFTGSPNGDSGYTTAMYFDLQSNGLYYIHPSTDTSICETLSTTQPGVSKTETCVGAANQEFKDINEGNGIYEIYNQDVGVYLNDPHIFDDNEHIAGTIQSCHDTGVEGGYGGCNFLQTSSQQ